MVPKGLLVTTLDGKTPRRLGSGGREEGVRECRSEQCQRPTELREVRREGESEIRNATSSSSSFKVNSLPPSSLLWSFDLSSSSSYYYYVFS